jgi:hypothetical protein
MVSLFGCDRKDILAAIGPHIAGCCYEVDRPVRDAFRKSGAAWDLIAKEQGEGKWLLDLGAANRYLLSDAGIPAAQIQKSDFCVSCNQDIFFSYRRDGGDTGRQAGFIMLEQEQ